MKNPIQWLKAYVHWKHIVFIIGVEVVLYLFGFQGWKNFLIGLAIAVAALYTKIKDSGSWEVGLIDLTVLTLMSVAPSLLLRIEATPMPEATVVTTRIPFTERIDDWEKNTLAGMSNLYEGPMIKTIQESDVFTGPGEEYYKRDEGHISPTRKRILSEKKSDGCSSAITLTKYRKTDMAGYPSNALKMWRKSMIFILPITYS